MSMQNKWNYPFVVLAALMVFPTGLSINAARYFMVSDSPTKSEALIGIGYLSISSAILWVPFAVGIVIFWRKLDRAILLASSVPFLLMLIVVIYGTLNGLPW